jgi:hypothetical protein
MQVSTRDRTSTGYVAIHPLDPEDAAVTTAMRAMVSSSKGARPGIEARGQFDALLERITPRADMTFEADTLGGVPGLWVHPADWRSCEVIVHLHGGWFNFGSAKAYRHLVGHIAARAGARAFIPDYRLAPEYPEVAGDGEQVSERRRARKLGGRNPSGRFTPYPTGGGSGVEPFLEIRGGHGISLDADVLGEEAREGPEMVAFETPVRVFKRANDQGKADDEAHRRRCIAAWLRFPSPSPSNH